MLLTYKETSIFDRLIDEKLHSTSSPTQFVFHWFILIIKELHWNIPRCQPKSNPSIGFLLCRSQRVRIFFKEDMAPVSLNTDTQRQTHSPSAVNIGSLILAGWSGAELSRESSTDDREHTGSVQRANSLVCSQTAPETYGTCHFIIKTIKLYFWGRGLNASLADEALTLCLCVSWIRWARHQFLITYSNSWFMTPESL